MNFFHLYLLIPSTLCTILQKKGLILSQSTKVIYKEAASSLLACTHQCTWRKSQVFFKTGSCKCFLQILDGGEKDEDLYSNQTNVYQQTALTGKSRFNEYCDFKVSNNIFKGTVGMYFFFNFRKDELNLKKANDYIVKMKNMRSGLASKAVVWARDKHGYNAYGRSHPHGYKGQFNIGDTVRILDTEYCAKEITF